MGACDCPSVVLPHARPSQACPGYVCGDKKKKKRKLSSVLRTQEPGQRQRAGISFLQPHLEGKRKKQRQRRLITERHGGYGQANAGHGSCVQAADVPGDSREAPG